MRGWLGALCLLTGCDQLFKLTHVDPPSDAMTSDISMPDGSSCISRTAHDEDGDTIHDDCDACPTVPSDNTNDSDGDGLSNECDPDLSTSVDGDMILLASVFASTTELATDYVPSGASPASVSADRLLLPPGAQVATMKSMLPTQMVATFAAGFSGAAPADTFQLGANGVNCTIAAVGCTGQAGAICVTFGPPVTYAIAASAIKRVTVSQSGGGLHCRIETAAASMTFDTTGQITTSVAFVRTTGSVSAIVENLVFYGEKP